MILTLSPCARALRNLINAADALAQLSPLDARALFAAPFGVNLYSVLSAALDLTGEHTGRAAVRVVELSAEVVIRISAPTGAGAELSAPLTLELFERLADGSCVRLIRDLERVEGAQRLAPVWSLPVAPRTFARYNLARYALSYAGGVALFQVERGLMVEVLEALGAKGLAAKALRAPAAELPAPVVEAPAPVSAEVVEAPRVTLRPRALTLRALRLAVAAKRGEGARVEPRPALRYAARAPFRALAYLAARHSAIYALLTSTASEARMSWRSCPRAAAEALRWEALAQSDARGCSYCPAGYTWRGVARAVARAEAAAAKAPRRRRAR